MSKGSKIINVRIAEDILTRMTNEIEAVNQRRREAPYDISSFIRQAIMEKLDHYRRARRPAKVQAGHGQIVAPPAPGESNEMVSQLEDVLDALAETNSEIERTIHAEQERRNDNA